VPAEASLALEVWCDGPTDQRWVQSQLSALAERASRGTTKTTITGGFTRPPWPPSARTDALADAWGHAARLVGFDIGAGEHSTASSDANLAHNAGIPALDGLGARGGALRTSDEWSAVEELPVRAAIAATGLMAWNAERVGEATWRVGGIIQGETPEDGEVQVSEPEDVDVEEATIEQDLTEESEAAPDALVEPEATAAEPAVTEVAAPEAAVELAPDMGDDIFAEPGALELDIDDDEMPPFSGGSSGG